MDDNHRKYLLGLLAGVASVALGAVFVSLVQTNVGTLRTGTGVKFALLSLVAAVLPSLIAVLTAYVAIQIWIARRGLDNETWLERRVVASLTDALKPDRRLVSRVDYEMAETPWAELFGEGLRMDIVARFANYPLEQIGMQRLQNAFAAGLRVRLIVSDATDPETRARMQTERTAYAVATGRVPENVCQRLEQTITFLHNARIGARAPAESLLLFVLQQPLNYSGYSFDDELLVYSPVAHAHRPQARPPRMVLKLSEHPQARRFWLSELEHATQDPPVRIDDYLAKLAQVASSRRSSPR